jgi:hypothetical protein
LGSTSFRNGADTFARQFAVEAVDRADADILEGDDHNAPPNHYAPQPEERDRRSLGYPPPALDHILLRLPEKAKIMKLTN